LSADDWDNQMLYFVGKGYRVISHDRRGHGRSSQPWAGNEMDTYADDLAQLFEKLDLRNAIMVGHSTGGGEVARYVARAVVEAGLASRAEVQVSYAIGVARPTSVMVTTQGTGKMSDDALSALVTKHFDLRPKGIIQMLDLLRPIYEKTAAYGHFGREEPEFTWEVADKALALKQAA
jgi:alpha-beta hydrolase superfamily lysophospholipase